MNITVLRLTPKELASIACSYTTGGDVDIKDMRRMYRSEHSPIRTQLFMVEMTDIPTFVSVHFVRHKVGVEHYVKTNREDRGGDSFADRQTPVNHMMVANAQALINMARKRLCSQASAETRVVMGLIKAEVDTIDPDLAACMVPDCEHRGGCHEFRSCGRAAKYIAARNEVTILRYTLEAIAEYPRISETPEDLQGDMDKITATAREALRLGAKQ